MYRIYRDGSFVTEVAPDLNGQLNSIYFQENLAGKCTFSVVAYDIAGGESKSVKATITIKDMTAPEQVENLSVRSGASELATTLVWDVPEDNVGVVSYEVYVDGKKYTTKKNSLTIKKLSAGSHQYTVIAVDKAKNKSQVSEALLFDVADSTAPKTGKLILQQMSDQEIMISTSKFSDNTGVAGYKIFRDGVFVTAIDANTDGQLSHLYIQEKLAGKYTFSVVAYDAMGVESKSVKATITIKDMTPPEQVKNLSVRPNATELFTTLVWDVPQDNVGVVSYEVYVDGKKYTTKTNSLTIKKLSAGTHQYSVIALDKAKHKSEVSEAILFDVADSTAPKAGKLTLQQMSGNEILLTVSKFSDNVGIVGYRIYQDGIFVTDVAANANGQLNYCHFQENLAGKCTFSVVAYDAMGVESKSVKATITIKDVTPPAQITELSVWPAANENIATLTWGIPADNVGVVSYEIYVDGKKYTSKTNTLTLKNLEIGIHQYSVIAVDKAKNKSVVSESLEFSVSAAPGIITIGGINNNQFHDIFDDNGAESLPAQAVFWDVTGTENSDEVLFSANQSRYIGSIRLGGGNDIVHLKDSTNYENDSKVCFRADSGIDLGTGNNFLYIGMNTELEEFSFLTTGNGNNTIEINGGDLSSDEGTIHFGDGNDIVRIVNEGSLDLFYGTLDFGAGSNQLLVEGENSSLESVNSLIFGDGNDFIKLSGGASASLISFSDGVDMGGGNDSLIIGSGCDFNLDSSFHFGEGSDELIVNGVLHYDINAGLSGVEKISGAGTVAVWDVENADPVLLQRFAAAGLHVVNTQELACFTTPQEERADDSLQTAAIGEINDDGELEYEFWLCSQSAADASSYGFADPADYLRFTKNSSHASLNFSVEAGSARLDLLNADGMLIRSFEETNYADYDLRELKSGTYYLKISVAEGNIASGFVEID